MLDFDCWFGVCALVWFLALGLVCARLALVGFGSFVVAFRIGGIDMCRFWVLVEGCFGMVLLTVDSNTMLGWLLV